MTYSFLPPALLELREAAEYYQGKVVGLGADFISGADEAIELILNYPKAWGKISGDYRHCNFRRFPYTLVYAMLSDDEVLIVSVFR